MRTGIGLLFRSFVSLLFTHAVLMQSRETLLCGVLGPKLLMVVGCITGLVGVILGYAGAVALDQYLRRLAEAHGERDATGAGA
jgi:hypothetical protein